MHHVYWFAETRECLPKQTKNEYRSPQLSRYGTIAALTTSGSGLSFESFAQGMCDNSMTKQQNPMCA